jgi:hypothetical protein
MDVPDPDGDPVSTSTPDFVSLDAFTAIPSGVLNAGNYCLAFCVSISLFSLAQMAGDITTIHIT